MYCTPAEVREMGSGLTTSSASFPVSDALLRSVIERASRFFDLECGVEPEYFEPALYPAWRSATAYIVGDIVVPTTANDHVYRVTTAGTTAASEPTWPTGSGLTVTNGTVVFTEYGADVVASERIFYGDGSSFLKLDPFIPETIDDEVSVPSGYAAPEFVVRDGYLVLASSGSLSYRIAPYPSLRGAGWYSGLPITVTAKWGYSETPEDVKMAVIELTINLLRETDPASLKLTGIDNQPLRESLPPRVREVAKKYRARQGVLV